MGIRMWAESWFLPPGLQFLMAVVGYCVKPYAPQTARLFALFAGLSLYLFSTPWGSYQLMGPLERAYPFLSDSIKISDKAAVVVLSARQKRIEPKNDPQLSLSGSTLGRLIYGISLVNRYHVPIWLSGGGHWPEGFREADGMSRVLESETPIQDWHLDRESLNTEENAQFTIAQIRKANIKQILLVTDAWHMPRSLFWFKKEADQYAIACIPAPLPRSAAPAINRWGSWLPHADALLHSGLAIREYAAWVAVWWRERFSFK